MSLLSFTRQSSALASSCTKKTTNKSYAYYYSWCCPKTLLPLNKQQKQIPYYMLVPSCNFSTDLFSNFGSMLSFGMISKYLCPDFLTDDLKHRLELSYRRFLSRFITPDLVYTIPEFEGLEHNHVYQAAEIYLAGKINPTTRALRLSKPKRDKRFKITMDEDEQVEDVFEGTRFTWRVVCEEKEKSVPGSSKRVKVEDRCFLLSVGLSEQEKVVRSYVPYVLERAKAIAEENKTQKIFTLSWDGIWGSLSGVWRSVNFEHPSTFDKLALDPELKKTIMDDLDQFVARKEYYKRVGKAWKRGYLLHGPPGTGKSSLIAAMANYLKFDVYDLDLTALYDNHDLKKVLVATANRSILVLEDIDCTINLKRSSTSSQSNRKVTLSGLLNFIDGLWSTCGDERIIIFTTNHIEKLDPALLRPGRMDVHVLLSYCTPAGFRNLAHNYLNIQHHPLFENIENLITQVQVTVADVAEKLMKTDHKPDVLLQQLVDFHELI